ncbi:hypothetical protein GVN20_13945 [Runella sp. CRIBMP]|uniref:tail fiber domain-containing protein n=1 Tax=Runella sp. CRIBMP TaxID=2683261 RepID=UPI00141211A7|nr:tail fiber domain-containing protein [Runella sp. CRIBMP]NBB20464.1 hypothetical protein [Runella sp. CRIBMP]
MKKFLFLCLLASNVSYGQIFTQSNTDGAITITPKGLQGRTNPGTDTTNVAIGAFALRSVIGSGRYNTAIGSGVLQYNTSGNSNTAIGYNSLYKNSESFQNTAMGAFALYSTNTTGNENTAVGYSTLFYNRTGSQNTAVGSRALQNNFSAYCNTAVGYSALSSNTDGICNTGVGHLALCYNGGQSNTAVGYSAGGFLSKGDNNTFIGSSAAPKNDISNNINNSTAIGANAVVDASNKMRFGNSAVTVIEGAVPWSTPSDRRLKENIVYTNRLGLNFINRLQTVSYNFISDKSKSHHDGFIAQDIEAVLKELNVPFSGLKKSDDGTYSLAYSDFVMPLVNAVKELKQKNEELEVRLSALEELKAEITKLKADNLRNVDKK